MMSNSHLTVPILDVLTNLNLTAALLAEVCASFYVGYYTVFQKNGHPFYFFHNSLK